MNDIDKRLIASMIDHTALKPEATIEDINKLCTEAKDNNFASVCINPFYVKVASENLKGTNVKVCTVIGFPLGANSTDVKAYEAQRAIADGAREIDMVINIGMLKAKNLDYVLNDIKVVVDAARGKALVKVIIETCLLTDDEKIMACKLSKEAGADFVKTSTGFNKSGATKEDVKIMRDTVGTKMGVKASGGIHTYKEAVEMLENGANRLGTSASLKIIE